MCRGGDGIIQIGITAWKEGIEFFHHCTSRRGCLLSYDIVNHLEGSKQGIYLLERRDAVIPLEGILSVAFEDFLLQFCGNERTLWISHLFFRCTETEYSCKGNS